MLEATVRDKIEYRNAEGFTSTSLIARLGNERIVVAVQNPSRDISGLKPGSTITVMEMTSIVPDTKTKADRKMIHFLLDEPTK